MEPFNAGRLNKRVTLQKPGSTNNDAGETVTTWSGQGSVWAEILPQGAAEFERVRAVHSSMTHQVTLRYRADLDNTWRILYGTRVFEILGIVNAEEKNAILALACEEHG
jgi:SPP1 family predicted phage head-tail adaptor